MLAYKSIPSRTAFPVERDEDCRSIWEHPTVQMYDPWGLGSGLSEHMTEIERAAKGGIGHGLVGTQLSCVNCVLFENIFWRGYLKTFTCAVKRDEDRRSIKENPTVQTYNPWGLGSGQSERMTQIARAAKGAMVW